MHNYLFSSSQMDNHKKQQDLVMLSLVSPKHVKKHSIHFFYFSSLKVTPRKESPEFLARKPSDNIWIRSFYPQQSNTLEAAVTKHKEYADPMMLNNMDGLIYADMQLDMKTKKKVSIKLLPFFIYGKKKKKKFT